MNSSCGRRTQHGHIVRGETRLASEIVPDVLKALERAQTGLMDRVLGHWAEVVGRDVRRHLRPESLLHGRLLVLSDSPVWIDEIERFHKRGIIEALNRRLGGEVVKQIIFRVDWPEDGRGED